MAEVRVEDALGIRVSDECEGERRFSHEPGEPFGGWAQSLIFCVKKIRGRLIYKGKDEKGRVPTTKTKKDREE